MSNLQNKTRLISIREFSRDATFFYAEDIKSKCVMLREHADPMMLCALANMLDRD